MVFWDASALVKAYLVEDGSPTVLAAINRLAGRLALTDFVALEVLTTITRQFRSKQIRKPNYLKARSDFLDDYNGGFEVIEVSAAVVRTAIDLADTHREIGVGAMDVLHVASALKAQKNVGRNPLVVASSDAGMLRLAEECGLRTFDPEVQPLAALMASLN